MGEHNSKLGKNLYIVNLYKMRDINSNYHYPVDFPSIVKSLPNQLKRGNWRSTTAINTPDYILKYYNDTQEKKVDTIWDIKPNGLNETETYELWGLILGIADVASSYEYFKFGNRGTSEGKNVKNSEVAKSIFDAIKISVERANELLLKIKGV